MSAGAAAAVDNQRVAQLRTGPVGPNVAALERGLQAQTAERLRPELGRGEPGSIRHGAQLGPGDRGVDGRRGGERGEAAVTTGDDLLTRLLVIIGAVRGL